MSNTVQTIVHAFFRCALICALTMLLLGCRRAEPTQTSPSQSAATQTQVRATQGSAPATESQVVHVTADEESTQSSGAQPQKQTIRFGTAEDLTIELPSGWEAVVVEPTEIERRLTDSATTGSDAAAQPFLDATDDETRIFAAVYTGSSEPDTTPLSLTVAVIPRHNLKLPQYIEELSVALDSAGVEVTRSGLLYDVRADGTPVGMAAFTLPPSDGQTPLAGYQLTQFDEGGENLAAMTWIGDQETIDAMMPDFHETAASIH